MIINPSQQKCNCLDRYVSNEKQRNCLQCNFRCQSCSPNDINSCTTCPDEILTKRINNIAQQCPCQTGFFERSGNTICLQCYPQCLECTDFSQCTKCNTSLNRKDNPPTCECQDGYIEDSSKNCVACDVSGCKTCPTQNTCQSCLEAYYPVNNQQNGSVNCQKCHLSCKTCLDGSSCQTCPANSQKSNDQQYCECLPGYYADSQYQCKMCDPNCKTCEGSSTKCTSCNSDRQLNANNICECKSNYYVSGSNCVLCHFSCEKCIGPNNNDCISCSTISFRQVVNQVGNKFECQCPTEKVENGVHICGKCHHSCSDGDCKPCNSNSCQPELLCQSCPSLYETGRVKKQINLTTITCSCADMKYDDGVQQICQDCHYTCKQCSGPGQNQCLQCPLNQQRKQQQNGLCSCQDGYLDYGQRQECNNCHHSCLKCSGSRYNQCTSCGFNENRIMEKDKCICQPGYYDADKPICLKCHHSCGQCTDYNKCTICPSKSFRQDLISQSNSCPCLDGYYDTGIKLCSPCIQNCKKCASSQTCEECMPNCALNSSKTECISTYIEDPMLKYIEKGPNCYFNCEFCFKALYENMNGCYTCKSGFTKNQLNQCVCEQNQLMTVSGCESTNGMYYSILNYGIGSLFAIQTSIFIWGTAKSTYLQKLTDISQLLSLVTFTYSPNLYRYKDLSEVFRKSQIYNLIPNFLYNNKQADRVDKYNFLKDKRQLQNTGENLEVILPLELYESNFLINGFNLLIFTCCVIVIYIILQILKIEDKNSVLFKLQKFTKFNALIFLYLFVYQDYLLYILMQVNGYHNSPKEVIDTAGLAIAIFFLIVIFLGLLQIVRVILRNDVQDYESGKYRSIYDQSPYVKSRINQFYIITPIILKTVNVIVIVMVNNISIKRITQGLLLIVYIIHDLIQLFIGYKHNVKINWKNLISVLSINILAGLSSYPLFFLPTLSQSTQQEESSILKSLVFFQIVAFSIVVFIFSEIGLIIFAKIKELNQSDDGLTLTNQSELKLTLNQLKIGYVENQGAQVINYDSYVGKNLYQVPQDLSNYNKPIQIQLSGAAENILKNIGLKPNTKKTSQVVQRRSSFNLFKVPQQKKDISNQF